MTLWMFHYVLLTLILNMVMETEHLWHDRNLGVVSTFCGRTTSPGSPPRTPIREGPRGWQELLVSAHFELSFLGIFGSVLHSDESPLLSWTKALDAYLYPSRRQSLFSPATAAASRLSATLLGDEQSDIQIFLQFRCHLNSLYEGY